MKLLPAAIRLYQKSGLVNTAVRLGVRAHHKVTPNGYRAPCPYPGQCSAVGLEAANTMGMAALPGIWSRMRACAPSTEEMECKSVGHDPDCNMISGGLDGCGSGFCGAMPHPMDPTDGCTGVRHSGSPKGC